MKHFQYIVWIATAISTLTACDITDNIPYPIVYGQITEFEVEGQCGENGESNYTTTIDKEQRMVTLYVCDTVDLSRLRITKITLAGTTFNPDVDYQETPALKVDSAACVRYELFPQQGFAQPMSGQDTRVDFRHDVRFVVHTYQDYAWTVRVKQVIKREIEVENQVGDAIIDPVLCNAVVYVKNEQSLKHLKVQKFSLGGQNGTVTPDPTRYDSYDFYNLREFDVTTGWGTTEKWNVLVFHTDAAVETTAQAFARNLNATISGTKPNGIKPIVEYKAQNETQWRKVPESAMTITATGYSAEILGLTPATKYHYRVTAGDAIVDVQEFTTVAIQQLPNAGFDEWSTDASNPKLLYPWADGATSFWDTGNRGATTVGNSNSVPTDDTSLGRGKAAYLESKWIVIKFAAGNIFTGSYLKTDGTNGVLGFGRPFTAFPTKLTFDYKYKSTVINKAADESKKYLLGRPDSCDVYIALWHIEDGQYEEFQGEKYPIVIRTKPGKEQRLFSANDPRVIAYGQFVQGNTVDDWTSETIQINYKNRLLAPTHIQIVATSSKYGDYFTGGVGSTLVLDNLQLIYE